MIVDTCIALLIYMDFVEDLGNLFYQNIDLIQVGNNYLVTPYR